MTLRDAKRLEQGWPLGPWAATFDVALQDLAQLRRDLTGNFQVFTGLRLHT
jgi:hypothetical protein